MLSIPVARQRFVRNPTFFSVGLCLLSLTLSGCSAAHTNTASAAASSSSSAGGSNPASGGSTTSGSTSGSSSQGTTSNAIVPNAPISGYHLTFDDEFNTLSVSNDPYADHTLWCSCAWWYPGNGTTNMLVSDGMLQMQTTQDADGNYVGAHLSTWSPSAPSFVQKFGYWEVRLKPSGQAGILDDFYLISQSNILTNGATPSNEIDIFEKPVGSTIYMTLHEGTGDGYQTRYNQVPVAADFDQNFHTIGMLWEEESGYIQWFIDGKQVLQEPKYNDTDLSPMVMTLETTVNGAYGAPDATTHFPAQSQVDYVRVFSNDPSIPLWTLQQ